VSFHCNILPNLVFTAIWHCIVWVDDSLSNQKQTRLLTQEPNVRRVDAVKAQVFFVCSSWGLKRYKASKQDLHCCPLSVKHSKWLAGLVVQGDSFGWDTPPINNYESHDNLPMKSKLSDCRPQWMWRRFGCRKCWDYFPPARRQLATCTGSVLREDYCMICSH
jgi:hypothetical protein